MNWIEKAKQLAHEAHDSIEQKRKYSGQPYWVHTDEVALLGFEGLVRDFSALYTVAEIEKAAAGYHLHDYREDVVTKLIELNRLKELEEFEARYREFPPLTQQVVVDLTDVYIKKDFPKLNRAARHERENERLSKIGALSKTGKLADLICNTRDITAQDPDFARVYLREKLALLPLISEGSPHLLQIASQQVIEGFKTLGMDLPTVSARP